MPATGASTVYQRQAGTGAAVMFGQSSFDPVQLAKYSNALAAAKDKAKTDAKQKKLDDLYKGLSITAGKVLETDQNYLNGYEDQFMNWKAKTITGNPTTQDMQDGFRYKTEFDQHKASLQQHKGMLDPYMGLIKNGAKNLDTDAMMENAGKFTQPDMYVDSDPDIAETFTPIYEHFLEDPVYGQDPEKALGAARTEWRNQYGREYVSEPILNDASLLEDYTKNVLPLVAEKNKQHFGKTLSDGTYIDEQYTYTLPYDTTVTTSDGEEITIIGTKTAELERYDDSPMIKKSADNRFKKLDDETKQDYIDQYGDDAAKNWNADNLSKFGVQASETNTTRKKTTGGVTNFGSYSAKTDWDAKPLTSTITSTRDTANKIWGDTDVDGFGVSKGENQLNLDKVVEIPFYLKANDNTQNRVPAGATRFSLAGIKPFMAPTFRADLTFDDFKNTLSKMTYDKPVYGPNGEVIDNAYDEFLLNFGKSYGSAEKTGSLQGMILTKKEQTFLKNIGLKNMIAGGKFVSGELSYLDDKNKKVYEPSAIIPLSFVNGEIDQATGIDFNKALDIYKEKYEGNVNDFENIKSKKTKVAVTPDINEWEEQ